MYVDVPVEVYIMSPRDVPPVFERNDAEFFLSEDAPIGNDLFHIDSVIEKMKIVFFGCHKNKENNNQKFIKYFYDLWSR